MKSVIINIASFFLSMFIFTLSSLYSGLILMKLWLWFVVPIFMLHPLTLPAALGFGLLVNYMASPMEQWPASTDKKNNLGYVFKTIFLFFGKPTLVLLFGALIHAFI